MPTDDGVSMEPHPDQPEDHYFDPEEELELIKSKLAGMSKSERIQSSGQIFDVFRTQIALQREHIAKLSNQVELYNKAHPQADLQELMGVVKQNAEEAKLSPRQIGIFEQKIGRLLLAEQDAAVAIEESKERYGDNWQKQLFHKHFGFDPIGRIDVVTSSGAIIFEVHSRVDWRNLAKWREAKDGYASKRVVGFVSFIKKDVDQLYLIGARTSWGRIGDIIATPMSDALTVHEAKHAQDFILDPIEYDPLEIKKFINSSGLDKDSNAEEICKVVESALTLGEDIILRAIRSEILAYFLTADYFFENVSSLKEALGSIAISLLNRYNSGHGGKFSELYRHGSQGEANRGQRNMVFLEIVKEHLEKPKSNGAYNYVELSASYISSTIKLKTGQDCFELVYGIAEKHFSRLKPRIILYIEAAISIIQHTKLTGREIDWLLQNEPMQYWPKLAEKIVMSEKEE